MSLARSFLSSPPLLACTHVGGSLALGGLRDPAGNSVCLTWGQPLIMPPCCGICGAGVEEAEGLTIPPETVLQGLKIGVHFWFCPQ